MRVGSLWTTASTAAALSTSTTLATAAFSTCSSSSLSRRHQRQHQRLGQGWSSTSLTRCFAASRSSKSAKSRSRSSKKLDPDLLEDELDGSNVDPASLPFASTYHAPVMWNECIEGLLSCERGRQRQQQSAATRDDGDDDATTDDDDAAATNKNTRDTNLMFVDGTLGGGGHSEALLQALRPGDVVFGCDVDPTALDTASQRLERYLTPSDDAPLFVPVQSNFAQLATTLPQQMYPIDDGGDDGDSNNPPQRRRILPDGMNSIDGILLDLGVSSHQIDTPERGFAFMKDGPLDMRMMGGGSGNEQQRLVESSLTAADLCNELEKLELARIFQQYGDEPRNRARFIAESIAKHRPLSTTGQLQEAVAAVVPAFHKSKRKGLTSTLARVFQSLRIVVNQEDRVLKQVLEDVCPSLLREGGRLVVLSYHSMEDRATKRIMRDGTIAKQRGSPERDIYGNYLGPAKPFRPLGKFQKASDDEIAMNSRARSATLRIAERLKVVIEDEDDGYNTL